MENQNLKIRWWPLVLILVLESILLLTIWIYPDMMRQNRFLLTYASVILTLFLSVSWAFLFSRLSRKAKLKIFSSLVLIPAVFFSLFEIEGVSGDFVLEFKFRWEKKPSETILESKPKTPQSTSPTTPRVEIVEDKIPVPPSAKDYPQFLGPNRTGILSSPKLDPDWESTPPQKVWEVPVGTAWSSFSISGGRALTQEQRGDKEAVTCYRLDNGDLLWTHLDEANYESVIAGDGPRATPTISEQRVYTLGSTGILNCLNLLTGNPYWTRNVLTDGNAELKSTEWGKSCSPLIEGNLVIVSAGGRNGNSLFAYNKADGEVVWKGGNDRSSYSSPMIGTLSGVRHIIMLNKDSVVGHSIEDGKVLWEYPWPGTYPSVAQPLVVGENQLFVSAGYGVGGKLLELGANSTDKMNVKLLWENNTLRAKFTNLVQIDGFVYGLSDGILTCQNLQSGKRVWKKGRFGHGQILLVGEHLLIQSEDGELFLTQPSPKTNTEFSELKVLDGKCWNAFALAGDYLLVRNDRVAKCYKLPTLENK